MNNKVKQQLKSRRKIRVRSKVKGAFLRPRFSVFRSLKHISVQIIDDTNSKTLISAKDQEIKADKKTKTEIAFEVGSLVAKKALEKDIKQVVFDRNGNRYIGRVKAVAEGARKGGLEF
ncbi:MAG: 50S ribosomal protein L18 [bacterium]